MITNIQRIDKHESVLIIGIGETNRYYMEIVKPESIRETREVFGECPLTEAYAIIADGHEDGDIYLLNIESTHDYLMAARLLDTYDFSYIVPVDVKLSDHFLDPTKNGQAVYYVQYLIKRCCQGNGTMVLATDRHASLYEDIDSFISDMMERLQGFKANASTSEQRESVIFVANNLSGVTNANTVLARMILNSALNEYPYENRKRLAVFDIDRTDPVMDMAYFRSHADGSVSIENLLNLTQGESPTKVFVSQRICTFIAKELSFEGFIGSSYTMYRKQQITSRVTTFLSSLQDVLLKAYRIDSVIAVEDPYHPGTVKIVLKYSIQPIGCSERYIQRTVKA